MNNFKRRFFHPISHTEKMIFFQKATDYIDVITSSCPVNVLANQERHKSLSRDHDRFLFLYCYTSIILLEISKCELSR